MAKRIRTTLGGDRVGSGNRNKIEMHNYYRSNHNLSCTRISSMAPGVLYPMYTQIGLTGDTFDIDLSAFVRTLPTEGPMFGAFKLQVDVFTADLRLYQAILHNNTTEIGYNMDQVLLPKMLIDTEAETNTKRGGFSKSSLMYYLGMAGAGRRVIGSGSGKIQRKINAVPMLAYYDIFKNYYANKQEDNAYCIVSGQTTQTQQITSTITNVERYINNANSWGSITGSMAPYYLTSDINPQNNQSMIANRLRITGQNLLNGNLFNFTINCVTDTNAQDPNNNIYWLPLLKTNTVCEIEYLQSTQNEIQDPYANGITSISSTTTGQGSIRLQDFPLTNIDEMRKRLLTQWDLGTETVIDQNEPLMPYQSVVGTFADENGVNLSKNCYPMQGLVVKCYQSDWFNNWLDTTYINQITQRSNVNVVNGTFSIDALNFAKKLYDHYNRIAVTGGSYDDWQKAAYGMVHYGKSEKPIYHGGMSSEVIFDEVVSSVGTADEPLGSLGGRGALKGSRGGHVIVKCDEQCVLMVMVSLTPRLTYSQGNAWYLTELDSINDLHQPDFDRIGFQDLMTEQLAWWDTQIDAIGNITRSSVGKQPAWLQYMTDVDKCYGDFAEENGKGFMVLQRLYDQNASGGVKDVTTYIDPTKYNYAFAVNDLTAQNFWTFLSLDIKARRLMSAKQMPNV